MSDETLNRFPSPRYDIPETQVRALRAVLVNMIGTDDPAGVQKWLRAAWEKVAELEADNKRLYAALLAARPSP